MPKRTPTGRYFLLDLCEDRRLCGVGDPIPEATVRYAARTLKLELVKERRYSGHPASTIDAGEDYRRLIEYFAPRREQARARRRAERAAARQ